MPAQSLSQPRKNPKDTAHGLALLKAWLDRLTLEQKQSFAKNIGTTLPYLKLILAGARPVRERLCINIERETVGDIRCEYLRPDVDWEFMRNTKTNKKND